MPNWITNKIEAPSHVIQAMINSAGWIDFRNFAPFPGPRGQDWGGIYGDAETAAEWVIKRPLRLNHVTSILEQANRRDIDIKKLSEESFMQFVGMLENYRSCGYLHNIEWNREKWGTKWNACESKHDVEAGTASFDTAWGCPEPLLCELSIRFPDDEVKVTYADEDIGSNCGTFVLKAGSVVSSDVAPPWREMTDDEKTKWRMFAYRVQGYSTEDIAEMEVERAAG